MINIIFKNIILLVFKQYNMSNKFTFDEFGEVIELVYVKLKQSGWWEPYSCEVIMDQNKESSLIGFALFYANIKEHDHILLKRLKTLCGEKNNTVFRNVGNCIYNKVCLEFHDEIEEMHKDDHKSEREREYNNCDDSECDYRSERVKMIDYCLEHFYKNL